jgi:hypothetical protein
MSFILRWKPSVIPLFVVKRDLQSMLSHGEGAQYRIAHEGGGTGVAYAGGNGDHPRPSISDFGGGGRHHVVVTTVNGGAIQIYTDGSFYSENTSPAPHRRSRE